MARTKKVKWVNVYRLLLRSKMARTKQTARKSTRQGPTKTAGHQGSSQERPSYRRSEEATSLQARHSRSPRNQTLPEEHRIAHPQAALPATRPWNRTGLQDRPPIPEFRRHGSSGGQRSLSGRTLRRHQPVRHPRQACHHHAKGHPVGSTHPWRTCLSASPSYTRQTPNKRLLSEPLDILKKKRQSIR